MIDAIKAAAATLGLIGLLLVLRLVYWRLSGFFRGPNLPPDPDQAAGAAFGRPAVLISLGSSGAVGNVVAGLVLTYADAFQPGTGCPSGTPAAT